LESRVPVAKPNMTTYDLKTACKYLQISRATMYRLVKRREIGYSKIGIGRGTYRFRQDDLDEYLDKNRVEPLEVATFSKH